MDKLEKLVFSLFLVGKKNAWNNLKLVTDDFLFFLSSFFFSFFFGGTLLEIIFKSNVIFAYYYSRSTYDVYK